MPKIGLISSENWDILGQFGFGGMGMSLLKYLVTDFSSKEKKIQFWTEKSDILTQEDNFNGLFILNFRTNEIVRTKWNTLPRLWHFTANKPFFQKATAFDTASSEFKETN